MDAYSNAEWLKVGVPLSVTTCVGNPAMSCKQLPEFCNGSFCMQLLSSWVPQEFAEFLKLNGIHHYKSVPYHPATNNKAEHYVMTSDV